MKLDGIVYLPLPGNRDNAFLLIVSVLPMAATRWIKILAVIFDEFDHRADFHRKQCWQLHFRSSDTDAGASWRFETATEND